MVPMCTPDDARRVILPACRSVVWCHDPDHLRKNYNPNNDDADIPNKQSIIAMGRKHLNIHLGIGESRPVAHRRWSLLLRPERAAQPDTQFGKRCLVDQRVRLSAPKTRQDRLSLPQSELRRRFGRLVDVPGSNSPRWISYSEPAFHSEVSCIYNASSAYRIDKLQVPSGWSLSIYQAAGSYPTGASTGGWVYVGYSPQDIFSWGAVYSNATRKSYVALATGASPSADAWSFNDFKNIQCQIDFRARTYGVVVNYTNNTTSSP